MTVSEGDAGRPIGWGILATGGIAGLFTRDLLFHGHLVAAIGSRSELSARAFAEAHGVGRFHGSYADLVADPAVDVVYVATPPSEHLAHTLLALEHGKHVLVEKPFTLNERQARVIVEEARRREVIVMEAMWTRFLPHMAFVRERIDRGDLGEITALHAVHAQRLDVPDHHRLRNPALGGGALLDLGVYPLSLLRDVVGEPELLSAQAAMTSTGVDASVATLSTHVGGAMATTFSSMVARAENSATIIGTEGRLELHGTWYAPTSVRLIDASGAVRDSFDSRVSGRGMQFEATEMERLIAGNDWAAAMASLDHTIAVMRTMDRVRASIGLLYPGEA
ncbi:Gfo/Idh/MocA family protein [Microcella sp.]|uniref:Gfo/Idh/MocA family protein n=1 Tax=Microcella sp. TaxID=1913979 RepID=UPI00391A2398